MSHTGLKFIQEWKTQSLEIRKNSFKKIMDMYPKSYPVILIPYSKTDPEFYNYKFIIGRNTSLIQIMIQIRSKIIRDNIDYSTSVLNLFVGNKILLMSNSLYYYLNEIDEDGFLYITYSIENTFG